VTASLQVKPSLRSHLLHNAERGTRNAPTTLQTFKPFKRLPYNTEHRTLNTELFKLSNLLINADISATKSVCTPKIISLQKSPNPTTRNAEHKTRNAPPTLQTLNVSSYTPPSSI